MDYELLTKLRDAGFPFVRIEGGMCVGRQKVIDFNPEGSQAVGAQHFYEPTLSELISACPPFIEEFGFTLTFLYQQVVWFAYYGGIGGCEILEIGKGATPEEAVARLYLALNKK